MDTWAYNLQDPHELNRYGYVANNPVNLSDPSGYAASWGIGTKATAQRTTIAGTAVGAAAKVSFGRMLIEIAVYVGGATLFLSLLALIPPEMWPKDTCQVAGTNPGTFNMAALNIPGCKALMERMWQNNGGVNPSNSGVLSTSDSTSSSVSTTNTGALNNTGKQPSQTPGKVRVRHYSREISKIKSDMGLKLNENMGFSIWVEYPIITLLTEKAIQEVTASFYRPLNGRGGLVEFDVDEKLLKIDPNLEKHPNSRIIDFTQPHQKSLWYS